MATPVQFRDENLALSLGLVGQTSQLTEPMDRSHKTLGFSGMDIIFMSRPGIWILRWAHRPNLQPSSSSVPDPIKSVISMAQLYATDSKQLL